MAIHAAMLSQKRCLIDLHLHLDGSLSLTSAREIAELQNIDVPASGEALSEMLSVSPDCRNLNAYLEKFAFPCALLETREAITAAVRNLCRELWEEGVLYAEIRFAPQKHTARGLSIAEVTEAAIEGLSAPSGGLILCCMRGADTKEVNLETVRAAAAFLGRGVLAVDLAGAEGLYPTEHFKEEFTLCRALGVPFTMHAGEAAGAESVAAALSMGASRIGHGVRAAEAPALTERLAKSGTPLEICPTSNLQTCVFSCVSDIPIRTFLERGVKFTINTDNRAVSSTTIAREWQLLIDAFALSDAEIRDILCTAARAAFCPAEEKERLLAHLRKELPI